MSSGDEHAWLNTAGALPKFTGRTRDLVLTRRALCVALLPVIVFYLGDLLIEGFGNPKIQIAFAESGPQQAEAGNRYFFLAAYLTLIVTASGIPRCAH
jgi:hypothetical protein